jgi:hypothetical protein
MGPNEIATIIIIIAAWGSAAWFAFTGRKQK